MGYHGEFFCFANSSDVMTAAMRSLVCACDDDAPFACEQTADLAYQHTADGGGHRDIHIVDLDVDHIWRPHGADV